MKMSWGNIKFKMKNAYKICKSTEEAARVSEPEKTTVYIIPEWLMHEKSLFGVRSNIIKSATIEKETAKAFRVYGEWFPKSQCDKI